MEKSNVMVDNNLIKLYRARIKKKKQKSKNWTTGYIMNVPYEFSCRDKIGKIECDCKECEEHFTPYYGFSWYHLRDCAMMLHIKKHPQICNLPQFRDKNFKLIARTD